MLCYFKHNFKSSNLKVRICHRAVELTGQKYQCQFACQRKPTLSSRSLFSSMAKLSLSAKIQKLVKLYRVCARPAAFLEKMEEHATKQPLHESRYIDSPSETITMTLSTPAKCSHYCLKQLARLGTSARRACQLLLFVLFEYQVR